MAPKKLGHLGSVNITFQIDEPTSIYSDNFKKDDDPDSLPHLKYYPDKWGFSGPTWDGPRAR